MHPTRTNRPAPSTTARTALRWTLLATTALATVGALAPTTAATAAETTPVATAGVTSSAAPTHGRSGGRDAVGLAGDSLVRFATTAPGATREIGRIVLDGDRALVGIDYRVQDGLLYGVGDGGGLYTLDDTDASATKIGQLSVPLEGAAFGVDFNPAANALRVVSDTGQNLRQPFATLPALAPTAVDGPLTNPATPPATGTVPASGVTGSAYTNNDLDDATTATTLFALDTALDRVAIQSPANNGSLAPTGKLPADVGPDAGFDIASTLHDGATVDNDAYAAVEVDGQRRLWAVDLLAGEAADRGAFDAEVTDLAITPRT